MRKNRSWIVFAGAALTLFMAAALLVAFGAGGAGLVHAQAATATAPTGIRTLITGTVEPAATSTVVAAATVAPTATGALSETGTVTGTLPVTPTVQPPRIVTGTVPSGVTRSLTVVGQGMVSLPPDTANASIGVQVVTDTVKAGTDAVSNTMASLLTALKAQGIADKDIQTSSYSISMDNSPVPGAPGAASQPRYQVSSNVSVTIRDLNKVGPVLDAAVNAGANNIYGVNFTLSNTDTADRLAYNRAMNDADARAAYLARLAGVELGPVISVSEVIGQGPVPVFSSKAAYGMGGGGTPIQEGQIEVDRQLQVVYSIHDLP